MSSGFFVTYKAFVPSGLAADEMASAAQKIETQKKVLQTQGFQDVEASSRFVSRKGKAETGHDPSGAPHQQPPLDGRTGTESEGETAAGQQSAAHGDRMVVDDPRSAEVSGDGPETKPGSVLNTAAAAE